MRARVLTCAAQNTDKSDNGISTRLSAVDEPTTLDSLARRASESRLEVEETVAVMDKSEQALSSGTSRLILLCVPLLWATYAPALRYVFVSDNPPGPAALSMVRIFMSTLPFAASVQNTFRHTLASDDDEQADALATARAALELGIYNSGGTALQAWGLDHTSSAHSGFIMGALSVVVPAMAVIQGDVVDDVTWAACAMTFLGVLLIGADSIDIASDVVSNVPPDALQGDVATFMAAMCYALFTLRASTYARQFNSVSLIGVKSFVMLCVMMFWYVSTALMSGGVDVADFTFLTSPVVFAAVVFSSLVPGALANYLQIKGQAGVPAAEAQIIYASTPAFNAVLSVALLNETMSTNALIGGGVIFVSSLAPFVISAHHSQDKEKE
jgi:drug/metabolite transporter (DMT)-like permease